MKCSIYFFLFIISTFITLQYQSYGIKLFNKPHSNFLRDDTVYYFLSIFNNIPSSQLSLNYLR